MRKKLQQWTERRLKASPAAFVGVVYASDEKAALKQAIEQFGTRAEDQKRLLIHRS